MNSVCLKHGRPQTLPSPSRFLLPLQLHVNVPVELSVCFVPVAQVLHAHDLLPQSVHQLLVTTVGNARSQRLCIGSHCTCLHSYAMYGEWYLASPVAEVSACVCLSQRLKARVTSCDASLSWCSLRISFCISSLSFCSFSFSSSSLHFSLRLE